MKSDIAIQLKHLSKRYIFHHEKPTLVEKFVHLKAVNEAFYALKDITVNIYKGQVVGIIGKNGSGKTTLLKIISGITKQSGGFVGVDGRIAAFLDVSAGFNVDLTGEQNIYLNGMLLGIRKKLIDKYLDEIIRFSGLGHFIDLPLYTYSQGMRLRLGFAVALHANPDILVLDENISVGDIEFQKIFRKKLGELFTSGKTVIIVTQWLEFLENKCNRILVLDEGKITHDGTTELIDVYRKLHR